VKPIAKKLGKCKRRRKRYMLANFESDQCKGDLGRKNYIFVGCGILYYTFVPNIPALSKNVAQADNDDH